MTLRPKTVRRLVILLLACGLATGSLFAVSYFHERSKERQAQLDRAAGMTAFSAGDYAVALARLKGYVGRHQDDFEAVYAYAVSRTRVEVSGGRHIVEAKAIFERLHDLRPDDLPTAHRLLEIYGSIHWDTETLTLAEKVLSSNPADPGALRAKSAALMHGARYGDALAVSLRLNDAEPLDLPGHLQTFELMRRQKLPSSDVLSRYENLLKQHPDDPRFELLMGLASQYASDHPASVKWLKSAASRPAPDAQFVQKLSWYLDQMRMFDESQQLLERAARDSRDPEILKVLVQRLWQDGRHSDVVSRLKELEAGGKTVPADLLAIKALSLRELGQNDDAVAVAAELKTRKNDNSAAAWAMALPAKFDRDIPSRRFIETCENAAARDRENGIIRAWIGDAYLRLGELDLAIRSWQEAAERMDTWAMPHISTARALLAQDRPLQAYEAARLARARAPRNIGANVTLVLAWYECARLGIGNVDSDKLRLLVENIQHIAPGEPETLPIHVALQVAAGKPDVAQQAIRAALETGKPLAPETLARLTEAARQGKLPIAAELVARGSVAADSTPRGAFDRAMELARAGHSAEGLDLLTRSAAASTAPAKEWKSRIALFREAIGDPQARDQWIALAEEYPDDIQVQTLVLRSAGSAKQDRQFCLKTIDRVRALTGDEGLLWRVEKARLLLSSVDRETDVPAAVGILTELVRTSPGSPLYRKLLAAGLYSMGSTKDAIDHLRAAVELDPHDVPALVDLSRLLMSSGKSDEARACIDRAAREPVMSATERLVVARLLAAQGDVQRAIDLLQSAGADLPTEGKLLLADLNRAVGKFAPARDLLEELLKNPACGDDVIASAADFFASQQDMPRARQVLSMLSDQRFSVTTRQTLLGRFEERYGTIDDARRQFAIATSESADDPLAWRELAEFELRQRKFDLAIAVLDQAAARHPSDPQLASVRAQAVAYKSAGNGEGDLTPLINALSSDPSNAAQVEALRVIQGSRASGASFEEVTASLRTLAEKYPGYLPVHTLLVQRYLQAGNSTDAAIVVDRLVHARPTDPDAARLAVSVYRATQRWRDMKRSAEAWRARSLENPFPSDLAIAEAMLGLDDAQGALKQLEPYKQRLAGSSPDDLLTLSITARALARSGQASGAADLLAPRLADDRSARAIWVSVAASDLTDGTVAMQWLSRVAGHVPSDSPDEQAMLAQAWYQAGARFSLPDATTECRSLLEKLAGDPRCPPGALLLLASMNHDSGSLDEAERLYRRVTQALPDNPDALNNLAYILLQKNGDMDEALSLATRATAARPGSASVRDTLARVQSKMGNRRDAIRSFERAVQLEPGNLEALIGLAATLSADGQRDKAQQTLRKIDSLLQGKPPESEPLKVELDAVRESLSKLPD